MAVGIICRRSIALVLVGVATQGVVTPVSIVLRATTRDCDPYNYGKCRCSFTVFLSTLRKRHAVMADSRSLGHWQFSGGHRQFLDGDRL